MHRLTLTTWLTCALKQAWHRARALNRRRLDARRTKRLGLAYPDWVQRFDRFTPELEAAWRGRWKAQAHHRHFDLLLPLPHQAGNDPWPAIAAVCAQWHPHWVLHLVHERALEPELAERLHPLLAHEPRVRLIPSTTWDDPSEGLQAALAHVCGDWVLPLHTDSLLPPQALLMMDLGLHHFPSARLLYTDEDEQSSNGKRQNPRFKPDLNPAWLLSHNYFGHATAYELALLRALGGWRSGHEGAHAHDLNLRALERLMPEEVLHIPHVLHHRRVLEGATPQACPGPELASTRAVAEQLQALGVSAQVERQAGRCRLRFQPSARATKVSVIVPTRDRLDLLRTCVQGVLEGTEHRNLELLIVDNGSVERETLAYFDRLRLDPRVRVLRHDAPFNYAELNNLAAREASGTWLLLLNNDIEVTSPDWLTQMLGWAQMPGVGIVGAQLHYPDQRLQHVGVTLGLGGVAGHPHVRQLADDGGYLGMAHTSREMSAVTAACLLVRRDAYLQVGGLDAQGLKVDYNDVDLCLAVRALGLRVVYCAEAVLIHHESASRGSSRRGPAFERLQRERALMQERWGPWLARDPQHNPNLSLEGPQLAWADPPRLSLNVPWFDANPNAWSPTLREPLRP